MKRLVRAAAAIALAALGCTSNRGEGSPGAADELARLAKAGAKTTFRADYRYEIGGSLRSAVETKIQVQQRPPHRVARIETSTPTATAPVVSWIADRDAQSFACSTYAGGDVWCVRRPRENDLVGYAQIDEPFRLAASRGFSTVKAAAAATVAGVRASCFDVERRLPPSAAPTPAPRFDPDFWRYRICYSADGVPLRLQRSAVESGAPAGAAFVFEATTMAKRVDPSDVELPGRVREAQQLISPTPTADARP